ncbi:hypothetical protein LG047_09510 [Methylocystis sp. WRRC1]|uniref:DUF2946 family protein n=1 Tax=Methylocystis sp. WRRC1 TaxID=1732014 RepID=UPI001D153EB1|nr:DUF2946 family protein [Methylocystis sp. WRRC1]MCC3245555.1 hypothetical protein [Methylocystis sp. WRRC1]
MSQGRDISDRLRAAIAVVAIWSLMFSVVTSGAVNASAATFALRNNAAASVGLFACFKRHMTHHADAAGEAAPEKRTSTDRHCPDCCLAAHAGAAVLPERLATVVRPAPAAAPVAYRVATSREPKSVPPPRVNGARAPPA